ncbi:hypothetical protein EIN_229090 [Entamoeba invadens IP1]|uniref:Uncharacterized protein n=1 Tax=Entamoeba invadens IP1 TaxID=370355 RepID=A0A0A1U2V4_ENTIV|nr:hypothetical protein EIN_229090 [Entamoeba invadens IP1]ELP88396.1 hypothetical protein EIN_229090 [Entamoeba invadens IP1]|eukprot:XP_004255167.1 hypothetical protein EIN_229090 [Entamoeba invadens IP1]
MTKFFDYAKASYTQHTHQLTPRHFDNVYISFSVFDTYDDATLQSYLSVCIPDKLLYIAVEGVTPLCFLRSRKRHYKLQRDLTPVIDQYITDHPTITVIVSNFSVAGMAHQKVLDFVRRQQSCSGVDANATHCFISNSYPSTYMSLHLPRYVVVVPSLNTMFDMNPLLLDIFKDLKIKIPVLPFVRIVDDIAFLLLMLENDVLPAVFMATVGVLFERYANAVGTGFVIENGQIMKPVLKTILMVNMRTKLPEGFTSTNTSIAYFDAKNDRLAEHIRKQLLLLHDEEMTSIIKCSSDLTRNEFELNLPNVCVAFWDGLVWLSKSLFNEVPDWDWHFTFHIDHFEQLLGRFFEYEPHFIFSYGRPMAGNVFAVLTSDNDYTLPSSISFLKTQSSEFYSFFSVPSNMNITNLLTLVQSKLPEGKKEDRWGWPTLFTSKEYRVANFDAISHIEQPSRLDIMIEGDTLLLSNGDVVEGNLVPLFSPGNEPTPEPIKNFRYGFLNKWYSSEYSFEKLYYGEPGSGIKDEEDKMECEPKKYELSK